MYSTLYKFRKRKRKMAASKDLLCVSSPARGARPGVGFKPHTINTMITTQIVQEERASLQTANFGSGYMTKSDIAMARNSMGSIAHI
jgi:hypothetical protein